MEANAFKKLDFRDVINLNVKVIEVCGFFCPDTQKSIVKVAYYLYAFILVGFIYILFLTSEIINMIVVFGDIEKMTEASFLLLTHLVEAVKLYVFVVHCSKVRRLINSINRKMFKPKNYEQCRILRNEINVSKKISKVFLFMGFATCVLWAIFPFIDKEDEQKNVKLPLSGWFPFSINDARMFKCAYIYQTIAAIFNALANISMDTFLSGIIMVISGQLKILNNSLQLLKQECGGLSREIYCSEKELIKNIIHHKNIIEFADVMTNLFATCILAQFFVSVIIICITMFQMSLVSVASLQFLSMVLYQGCMLLEIFLWCYYGNEVIVQSGKLTESAYMCEWLDCSKKFKKDLLYFMTRSQVPLKLYAGGYFTLSLETFIAIVKSSWSYFAVLNRVHSVEGT